MVHSYSSRVLYSMYSVHWGLFIHDNIWKKVIKLQKVLYSFKFDL